MDKPVVYDIEGQEVVTTALMELINQYPGLMDGDEIKYSVLAEDGGKAIFPTSGAAIRTETRNILGRVKQYVDYPFIMIYRASGLNQKRKENAKEWLDNLGRWLEKQPIVIQGQTYHLDAYPVLTRDRKFDTIKRTSVSYLDSINESKAENWAINITATYINEFRR